MARGAALPVRKSPENSRPCEPKKEGDAKVHKAQATKGDAMQMIEDTRRSKGGESPEEREGSTARRWWPKKGTNMDIIICHSNKNSETTHLSESLSSTRAHKQNGHMQNTRRK